MSLHLKSSARGPIHTDPYLRKSRSPTSRAVRSPFEIQSVRRIFRDS
ncbi:MAG: hypothetical protein IJE97_02255 [Thermoguttaceae bacterium]|nr:hypothetical protein [Thermoguttaceae bacterium]